MEKKFVFVIYDLYNKELPVALFDTYKDAVGFLGVATNKYNRKRVFKKRYLIIKVNISR
jgi:hypothetical protein